MYYMITLMYLIKVELMYRSQIHQLNETLDHLRLFRARFKQWGPVYIANWMLSFIVFLPSTNL